MYFCILYTSFLNCTFLDVFRLQVRGVDQILADPKKQKHSTLVWDVFQPEQQRTVNDLVRLTAGRQPHLYEQRRTATRSPHLLD